MPGTGDPAGICVCEFQEQFGLAQSKASYHLRVLKDAGLVTEETRGKWSFYAVDAERVAETLRDLGAVVGLDAPSGLLTPAGHAAPSARRRASDHPAHRNRSWARSPSANL